MEKKCSICNINSWNGKDLTLELDHINGIHNDNRIENLAWGTAQENSMDKKLHGTLRGARKGELHPNARLSNEDVLKIKLMVSQGVQKKTIAMQYNVDPSTISHLRNRSSATQK